MRQNIQEKTKLARLSQGKMKKGQIKSFKTNESNRENGESKT